MSLRLAFMGTPEFSVPTLQALIKAGHEIVAVYSQPPRKAGRRGLELTPSPIEEAAHRLGLPVFTPLSLKNADEQEKFQKLNLDAAIVVAYGLLLPKAILDAPRFGCYNGHASLLPRWRGAAPIQRAIMAGDNETGMMIMKMDEGLDTGPVALCHKIAIGAEMTSGELHDALSHLGAALMVDAMEQLEQDSLQLHKQSEDNVSYAKKIDKNECRIDWSNPGEFIQKQICGLSPFPGAWCEMRIAGKLERVKILGAKMSAGASMRVGMREKDSLIIHCGQDRLEITKLQKAGGKILDGQSFLRGFAIEDIV